MYKRLVTSWGNWALSSKRVSDLTQSSQGQNVALCLWQIKKKQKQESRNQKMKSRLATLGSTGLKILILQEKGRRFSQELQEEFQSNNQTGEEWGDVAARGGRGWGSCRLTLTTTRTYGCCYTTGTGERVSQT